ncbi:sialidase family protein [Thiomicrorhabdus sp.]|uniref:sialidase family protein n=1 Tax=Thiomicrorhabdus sp. TaxID=2039724 RepID=UPI00356A178B
MNLIKHEQIQLDFKLAPVTDVPVYLHEKITPSDHGLAGPFVRNRQGELVGFDANQIHISQDEGQTWQAWPLFDSDDFSIDDSRSLICLESGVILLSFVNTGRRHFNWHRKTNKPTKNSWLFHWIMRSPDGGRTWEEPIRIQTGYAAATTTIIQLKSGEIVVSAQNLDYENGRHYALSFRSDDDGLTWQASNRLDIGGQGHHGGCYEGTLVELKDKRLWYCIRTNRDWFWHAYSNDKGFSWTHVEPGLAASSSPGMLTRLDSGRLMLTYNQLYKQGEATTPRRAGLFSEVAASWQREELSVRFSDDDGDTWSEPIVVASCNGAWLAYPMVFEATPGEIWITTMQSELKIRFFERDLTV